jgi:hypothetical protein
MILANLKVPYERQVLLAINEWGELCRSSPDVRGAEPATQTDSELEIEDLDAGRLLEACVSALSNDSQAHRLLTVSQYGCAIGDSYMAKLLIVFQNTLEKELKGGTQLPLGMTSEVYLKLVCKDSSTKLVYTMPMHLWLFKTLSTESMAQALVNLSAYRFKTVEKGMETVSTWRSAALSAVKERNPKWLRTMKHPDKHDMRAACENFMPKWIKVFSAVIRKGNNSMSGGMNSPARNNIKRKSLMAMNAAQLAAETRWEDEVFVRLETDDQTSEDELTGVFYLLLKLWYIS